MSIAPNAVKAHLQRLPPRFGLRLLNDKAMIRCPFHAGGHEKVGSLQINIERNGRYYPGDIHCFGCGKHGRWNTLAKELGLPLEDQSGEYIPRKAEALISDEERNAILGDDDYASLIPRRAQPWDARRHWRNINGATMVAAGSLLYPGPEGKERAFMPVTINGDLIGGVKANVVPVKNGPNYFNTKDDAKSRWKNLKGLYPYDLVRDMMDKIERRGEPRWLALIEGPRDALNLVQHGLPATALLGADTSWSQNKADLILDLDPALIVLAFDPDDPGDRITLRCRRYFHRYRIPMLKINFPYHWIRKRNAQGKLVWVKEKDMDASDMSQRQCQRLQQRVADRLNFRLRHAA